MNTNIAENSKMTHVPPNRNDMEVWTVDDVAKHLKIDRKTVLDLFHSGEIPGKRLGKKIIRFRKDIVLECLGGQGCVSSSSEVSDEC